MPTNLPPEYFEADQRYRAAKTTTEKVTSLEELISTIPKHKGTDKLRADLRKRLSKLKSASQVRKGTSKRDTAFSIDREGAGQVVVVGHANVGKSALVATLTNATPEVAAFPFTTWEPTPGMMPMENIQIQLVDTPPLNKEYLEPEMFSLIRRSDLILLVVDLQTDPLQQLEDSIAVLRKQRIVPCHLKDRHRGKRRVTFKPVLVLANKYDDEAWSEDFDIFCELLEADWPLLPVSATSGRNLEHLKRVLFDRLEIIRVYSRAPGQEPDYSSPFTLQKGATIEEFARNVHQDFYRQLKAARMWGSGAFEGQMVGRDHVLQDGDEVELRI